MQTQINTNHKGGTPANRLFSSKTGGQDTDSLDIERVRKMFEDTGEGAQKALLARISKISLLVRIAQVCHEGPNSKLRLWALGHVTDRITQLAGQKGAKELVATLEDIQELRKLATYMDGAVRGDEIMDAALERLGKIATERSERGERALAILDDLLKDTRNSEDCTASAAHYWETAAEKRFKDGVDSERREPSCGWSYFNSIFMD